MKYRICKRYNPITETWFVVQKRRLFWWKTLPFAFKELDMANRFIDKKERVETIYQTPLSYDGYWSKEFKDIGIIQRGNFIKIKT